jgi:hypothetical protein
MKDASDGPANPGIQPFGRTDMNGKILAYDHKCLCLIAHQMRLLPVAAVEGLVVWLCSLS